MYLITEELHKALIDKLANETAIPRRFDLLQLLENAKLIEPSSGASAIAGQRLKDLERFPVEIEAERNPAGELLLMVQCIAGALNGFEEVGRLPEAYPQDWNVHTWQYVLSRPRKEQIAIAGALLAAEYDRLEYEEKKTVELHETPQGEFYVILLVKTSFGAVSFAKVRLPIWDSSAEFRKELYEGQVGSGASYQEVCKYQVVSGKAEKAQWVYARITVGEIDWPASLKEHDMVGSKVDHFLKHIGAIQ